MQKEIFRPRLHEIQDSQTPSFEPLYFTTFRDIKLDARNFLITSFLSNVETPTLTPAGEATLKTLRQALQTNQTITSLSISYLHFNSFGAKAIADALNTTKTNPNRMIQILKLSYNHIGNKGAEAIAEALQSNAVITDLYLGYNRIGDPGVKAIASALRVNEVLTSLNLNGNNGIGSEGANAIADALSDNKQLKSLTIPTIAHTNDLRTVCTLKNILLQ